MNKKKEIVPKLRFPEYIGNKLKITKLGKITSTIKEKAGEYALQHIYLYTFHGFQLLKK